jgi:hypothetical protein
MTASSFYRPLAKEGISAFNARGQMIMSMGEPLVQRHFTVNELQEFICTLEKAVEEEPNFTQRLALQRILCCFVVSIDTLKENHEEFMQYAPTGADLEEYMTSYCKAIKGTF